MREVCGKRLRGQFLGSLIEHHILPLHTSICLFYHHLMHEQISTHPSISSIVSSILADQASLGCQFVLDEFFRGAFLCTLITHPRHQVR